MAERINRLGVDKYTIKINDEGEIFFTTGVNGSITIDGSVNIGGDLVTGGNSTSISREDLVIYDNLIELNKGGDGDNNVGIRDLGDGRISGLKIYRGQLESALLVFDESVPSIGPGAVEQPGSISFQLDNSLGTGDYVGINTTSIRAKAAEDLHIILDGNGIVRIEGLDAPNTYEKNVWDYNVDGDVIFNPVNPSPEDAIKGDARDALITAQALIDFVDGYHLSFFQSKLQKDDSRVEIFDSDVDGVGENTRFEIALDEDTAAIFSTFYPNRVEFGNLLFQSDPGDVGVITSNGLNADIRLRGTGTGVVQIDGWQNFTLESDPVSAPSQGVTIYSKTLGDGGSGLYFYNQDGTQDEFVSRGKALLYSIIF